MRSKEKKPLFAVQNIFFKIEGLATKTTVKFFGNCI